MNAANSVGACPARRKALNELIGVALQNSRSQAVVRCIGNGEPLPDRKKTVRQGSTRDMMGSMEGRCGSPAAKELHHTHVAVRGAAVSMQAKARRCTRRSSANSGPAWIGA